MRADRVANAEAVLVGRREELASLAASLERGGCVIAGAMGVGKSRLAAEAAGRRPAPTVRVVATGAAASVPFGAFAHLLADADVETRGPIGAGIQMLRRVSPDAPPTLVVDDAHLLDDASAALVLAVAQGAAAQLLVTLRRGEHVADAVTALWKDLRLARLDLEPLSRRELRDLVEAHLGGPADATVHARVYSLTRGNPLYAHELLVDARGSGAVAEVEGRWRWTGSEPELPRLRELVLARTGDLSARARDALELLVVGGPLGLDVLMMLAGEDGVAELERAGLVAPGGVEAVTVELGHPLLGEVILSELPAATAREHRRRLAVALEGRGGIDMLDLLRLASYKLEAGEFDPQLFLRAGAYALQVTAGVPGPGWGGGGDPALAIRLADAAGPGLVPALLGARGRMALGRFRDVAERLAPLEGDAVQAPFEQAAEYLRTLVYALHWDGGTTAEALALLDRAASWRDEPDWRALHATATAWVLHDLARPASASDAIRSLPGLDTMPPQVRLDALVVLALTESRVGRTGRCEALEPEIQRLVEVLEHGPWQTGWARYLVDGYARADAARDLPQVAARLARAREQAEAAGDVPLTAALGLALGRLDLLRGHVTDAVALLDDTVDGLSAGDPRNALAWALVHLTCAHALAGDLASARSALARAEAVAAERTSHLRLQLEVERARAWVDAASGCRSAARERVLAVADAAGEALLCEADAVYDALRFGAAPQPCAQRLTALAARADNDRLDACAEYATALANRDAEAQLRAAQRFAGLGLDLPAAEAAAVAARRLVREGRLGAARRAAALAARHGEPCQGVVSPALALTPAGDGLTPRELEIAMLAARGSRNAEIAERIGLSVRTVETYVLRACRKLGVDKRTELAEVLVRSSDLP